MLNKEDIYKLDDDTYYDTEFEGVTVSGIINKRYSGREIKVYCKNPEMVNFGGNFNPIVFRLTNIEKSSNQQEPDDFEGPTVW